MSCTPRRRNSTRISCSCSRIILVSKLFRYNLGLRAVAESHPAVSSPRNHGSYAAAELWSSSSRFFIQYVFQSFDSSDTSARKDESEFIDLLIIIGVQHLRFHSW